MKTHIFTAALAVATTLSASAITLVEVDFSGSGAVGTIASSDGQFTVKNSAVTFGTPGSALASIGGGSSTGGWNFDGTNTAATNNDLHIASTFGAPTRFDLDLSNAASGQTYTITSVEIDVRAHNTAANWDFMYRDTGGTTQILSGGSIDVLSGADPIETFSITVAGGLTATDSATDWNTTGTGKLRFAFYDATGTNADNLQIDAIRVIGTVPEPSAYALIGGLIALSSVMVRRRR